MDFAIFNKKMYKPQNVKTVATTSPILMYKHVHVCTYNNSKHKRYPS